LLFCFHSAAFSLNSSLDRIIDDLSYSDFDSFEGWDKFPGFIQSLIVSNSCRRVAEIGGGANPAVAQDFAHPHGLSYVAIDADPDELAKAGPGQQLAFDLCGVSGQIPGAPYDLIFSRMTAEHFSNVELAYRNILCSLNPGGLTVHSFASFVRASFCGQPAVARRGFGLAATAGESARPAPPREISRSL
jgi:hypothetical protein